MHAIFVALQVTLKFKKFSNKYLILTDSLSSLQSLKTGKSKSRPEIVTKILESVNQLKKINTEIEFIWVPSHCNITGNEKADQLAKIGSEKGPISHISLSVKEVYSIIKEKVKNKFAQKWREYDFANKDIFDPIPSKIISYSNDPLFDKIYTRLRLNASKLGAEGFKPDKNCQFCSQLETFDHVFFECTLFSEERQSMERDLYNIGMKIINKKTLLNPPANLNLEARCIMFDFINEIGYKNKI